MRAELINAGDELYYASSTRAWKLRPAGTEWGRAVVTDVAKYANRTYVLCDLTLYRWNSDKREFEPYPHTKTGCKVAVRYFRGRWQQVWDATNDDATAYRIKVDESIADRTRQREEDRRVSERAKAIGLEVSPFGANGTLAIRTDHMATILDHLQLTDTTFHNG